MKNAFIFHGTGGHAGENWFPWLKSELEKIGYEVFIPQFPTPENQTLEMWMEAFGNYEKELNSDTLLIGHSLGGAFLLRLLEKSIPRAKAAFFISVPVGVLPIKNYEGDKPFIGHPFLWHRIRVSASNFFVFHSSNDEMVSIGNGKEIARNLNVELTVVSNAGHFNAKAGYLKFDLLLEKIKLLK